MLHCLILLFCLSTLSLNAQQKTAESFGFRHFRVLYQKDTVEVLIKSKKGDELKKKPLFLFAQGSLPVPLIIYDTKGEPYGVFPFKTDSLLEHYHLAIIGKPGIPVTALDTTLPSNYGYVDPVNKNFVKRYLDHNYINYYAGRDKAIITHLLRQPWISHEKVVVSGHSEGAIVALRLASTDTRVGRLIYSGGNPLGRMMSIVQASRENDTIGKQANRNFRYWASIIKDPESLTAATGDANKTTYEASVPSQLTALLRLKIPVLISYGTKDYAVQGCDYLHLEAIRLRKTTMTFKAYTGLEHNYFPLDKQGRPDYNYYNWDKVALDWKDWLLGKTVMEHIQSN